MKSFFRLILLALILLMVALVSALTAMRFAIHGREVATPGLVGKTPAEARRIADHSGLQVEVERQYYSAEVPEGKIISQLPEPGALVRRGWQVRIAESLGPQRVEIPNVLGQTERVAEINIRRRGLDVGAVADVDITGVPADQVIAQSPPPNASGVAAPKISLLVTEQASPPAFVMPDLTGQQLGKVTVALQDANLRLGTVNAVATPANPPAPGATAIPLPSATPISTIVSQLPASGQKVTAGSVVNLEVR